MAKKASYLRFVEQPHLDGRPHVTKRWQVTALDGTPLGQIKWYSPWRRYCFMPNESVVFDAGCLEGIATYLQHETYKHKEARRDQVLAL